VCDVLQGGGNHAIESFIHLHPDFTAEVKGSSIVVLAGDGRSVATIEVEEQ